MTLSDDLHLGVLASGFVLAWTLALLYMGASIA